MSVEAVVSVLSGFLAILGALAAIAIWLARQAYGQGQLALKVDTLWDFIIRRGKVEAVQKGWAEMNSPIVVTVAGLKAVMPFLGEFLPFYRAFVAGKPIPAQETDARKTWERELTIAFEAKFGDFVVERICLPNGVSENACWATVLQACEDAYCKRA